MEQRNDIQGRQAGSELERLFPGGSEMAGRMRAFDWSKTDLGPPEGWPENLRVAVRLCLTSHFSILLWWGPRLTVLYNDAHLPFLGPAKHPRVLGGPGRECWGEIWDTIGPMLVSVMTTGKGTWSQDMELFYDRKLRKEEVFVTFTYAPILAADGRTVDGVFCPCAEMTGQVVGARRLETLRKLGIRAREARTVEDACKRAVAVLSENTRDIPFAAIYVVGERGDPAMLSATMLPPGDHLLPASVSVSEDDSRSPWPLASVLRTRRPVDCVDLAARGIHLPGVPWPEEVRDAIVLPVHAAHDQLAGLLVVGVSPRRPIDAEYRTFFELVAGHIAKAISDARAYEAERRRAEALAELDRAKTTFFSNVSHEFRTPLTLLLGPVEDALADPVEPLPPGQRERLETVHRSSLRLMKLVNTLLDFSRMEAGRAQAVYEPTDLTVLTAELASNFQSACDKAGLRLVVDCPPQPEPVYVDRDMWEKVVLNLVSNAFKFTFEGEITIRLRDTGDAAELSVHDTGTGIPAEELPRIFERFHRVEGSRGRTYEGTGIGLALVQELVKLHGGSVRAESTYRQGSTFVVSIPRGKDHLPADRIGAPRTLISTALSASPYVEEMLRWLPGSEVRGQKSEVGSQRSEVREEAGAFLTSDLRPLTSEPRPRVLWADDNADMRNYVRRLLGERYDVEAVPDGEAALAAARARPPDLILTDVMMPQLDGFGLLRALRADPRIRTIPVILLSARAGEESRVEGLEVGADDYLVKPFSARELLARVGAHIEMNRLRQEVFRREQALLADTRAVKQRLATVLQRISDGFLALDGDWRYTALNDRACENMGMSREDILGRRIWDLYPDTVGTPFEMELRRAVTEQRTVLFEYFYPVQNRWYENRVYPSADGLSIFYADVTERKQAEEALHDSEARFRGTFENAAVGIGHLDRDCRYIRVNRRFCNIMGYSREELRQATCLQLTHPEDMKLGVDQFDALMRGELQSFSLEKRYLRKGGALVWVNLSVSLQRDTAGNPAYAIETIQDISDRKSAQEALRLGEQRLGAELAAMKRLQEVSTRLVQATDPVPLLEEIMAAAIAITGADMGNMQLLDPETDTLRFVTSRGLGPAYLDHFSTIHGGLASCGAALKTGARIVVGDVTDSLFTGKDLAVMLAAGALAVQSTPLVGRSGRIVGMLSTHYRTPRVPAERDLGILDLLARQAADWIERTRAEEALREARDGLERWVEERTAELAQANDALHAEVQERRRAEEARTELLRRLATAQEGERRRISRELHDQVGQQLTSLTLGLRALRDSGQVAAPGQELLERLQRTAEEVGRELHDVSLRLRPTALDDLGLPAALHSAVEEWSRRAGVEVDFHSSGLEGRRLPGEAETTLYRVVLEALHNILKHAGARHVGVILERRDHYAVAIIEDDGNGFDAELAMTGKLTRRLGLLGMRERVALVGGTLEVESAPGAGTTVFARIPLPPEEGDPP